MQFEGSVDFRFARLAREARLEGHAEFGDASPLALGFFAFISGEGREEVLEITVVAIPPMKLAVATQQPIVATSEQIVIARIGKQQVCGL